MSTFWRVCLALMIAAPVCAQDTNLVSVIHDALSDDRPRVWTDGFHPFLETALDPGGMGFGWGFVPSAGGEVQWKHLLANASVSYGFIRKVNDADQVPHEKGHTRHAGGDVFWRWGRNYVGAGARWGETAVTPYRKYSWAPEIAVGHEYNAVRLQIAYFRAFREYTDYPSPVVFTPGPGQTSPSTYCLCTNGVTGFQFDAWLVPLAKSSRLRHLQFHWETSIIRFHDTVTDPYNLPMTRRQTGNRSFGGDMSLGLVYRR